MLNHDNRAAALTSLESVFTILNTVSDALCIYDCDGTIVLVNDEFARITGLERQRLEGQDARMLFLKIDGTPVMPNEELFLLGTSSQKRYIRLPEKGERLEVQAKAVQLTENGFVLVCLQSTQANDTLKPLFPLSPKALDETSFQRPNFDSFSSESLTQLLSLTKGKKHESADRVQIASEDLWIKLHSHQRPSTRDEYKAAVAELAHVMHCDIWEANLKQNVLESIVTDAKGTKILFPFTFDELKQDASHGAVRVILPSKNRELASWMKNLKIEQTGFLVLMSPNERQAPYDFLVLRDANKFGPLDEMEITFFKRFVQNIYRDERYANQQAQDTYISQTLQLGMGNRLHKVEGLRTAGLYNSATATAHIGGDFYTVIRLAPHKACIILGDVTGKGVAAASVSSAIKTTLVAYAWEGQTPSYIARAGNDFFMGFSRLETFATAFIGILDTQDGLLSYCSAGHLPAIIVRNDTGKVEMLDEQSGVLGAFQEMVYNDGLTTLLPGDKMLLYTDGVTEARNAQGAFFGEQKLTKTFKNMKNVTFSELPDAILQNVLNFSEGKLDDDIALLAIEIDAEE